MRRASTAVDKLGSFGGGLDLLGGLSSLAAKEAETSPASAALDSILKASASRKRLKLGKHDSPASTNSLINFNKGGASNTANFDMTDLFQATESDTNKISFDFPTLAWDFGDDDNDVLGPNIGGGGGGGSPASNALAAVASKFDEPCKLQHDDDDDLDFFGGSLHGRSKSQPSLLLGKRNRSGGMLRSKTMRSEVDGLISYLGDHHRSLAQSTVRM